MISRLMYSRAGLVTYLGFMNCIYLHVPVEGYSGLGCEIIVVNKTDSLALVELCSHLGIRNPVINFL